MHASVVKHFEGVQGISDAWVYLLHAFNIYCEVEITKADHVAHAWITLRWRVESSLVENIARLMAELETSGTVSTLFTSKLPPKQAIKMRLMRSRCHSSRFSRLLWKAKLRMDLAVEDWKPAIASLARFQALSLDLAELHSRYSLGHDGMNALMN